MFKLNTQRTYKYPVNVVVYDEDGKERKGSFTAIFKVLSNAAAVDPANAEARLLDLVLAGVDGVEIAGEHGNPLQGDELLAALKDDPSTSTALISAYNESVAKKNRPKT